MIISENIQQSLKIYVFWLGVEGGYSKTLNINPFQLIPILKVFKQI